VEVSREPTTNLGRLLTMGFLHKKEFAEIKKISCCSEEIYQYAYSR